MSKKTKTTFFQLQLVYSGYQLNRWSIFLWDTTMLSSMKIEAWNDKYGVWGQLSYQMTINNRLYSVYKGLGDTC